MLWQSIFYFVHFAFHSVLLVFLPIHCQQLGFSAFEISFINGSIYLAMMLASPIFTQLLTSSINTNSLILKASFISTICFGVLEFITDFNAFIILLFFTVFFVKGAHIIVEAKSIRYSETLKNNFHLIRIGGSLGFMIAVFTIGFLIDKFNWKVILPFGIGASITIIIVSLILLKSEPELFASSIKLKAKTKFTPSNSFLLLLLIQFLSWVSHAPFYTFFAIYLREIGWSTSQVSLAWNLGVLAEVILFYNFYRLQSKMNLGYLLIIATFLTTIRWLLIALSKLSWVIFTSQILHAATFGLFFLVSTKLVFHLLPEDSKDRGQGVLAAAGVGMGSLAGRILFAYLSSRLQSYQNVNLLFYTSALISFACFILAVRLAKMINSDLVRN
ncbi:MAG: MFS transporter [Bdellovibrionales bacterium]|nr:MFS transporter [Bdellovibrionales bacterium]